MIKKMLPAAVRRPLREIKRRLLWGQMMGNWERAAAACQPPAVMTSRGKILIFPSDYRTISGSRGDDAMLTATIEACRAVSPEVEIDMACMPISEAIVREKGFAPLVLPENEREVSTFLAETLKGAPYDAAFVLGADVMDGYYSPAITAMLVIAADISARSGIPATILGCSFNANPPERLREVYARLSPEARLNVRDPVSFERIKAFAPVNARLVADAAFALEPSAADPDAVGWIEEQRAAGRQVIGLNIHPMLIKNVRESELGKITGPMVNALARISNDRAVSWMMLPHDYRSVDSDLRCLTPLHEGLRELDGVETYLLEGEPRATELKALAGHLDGVVSGRMHLAIAALGMGVPVLGIAYQGKFEGLLKHFGLPESLMLTPQSLSDVDDVVTKVEAFLADLPDLTQQVERNKPRILALAHENFVAYAEDRAA